MKRPTLGSRGAWWLNLAIVAATLATIPVVVLLDQGWDAPWLHIADWMIWAVFVAEYAIEMFCAPSRSQYARRNWISPLVIVLSFPLMPDLLAGVRVARVVRLLRFTRLVGVTFRGLTELRAVLARRGLIYTGLTSMVLVFAGAAALEVVEPSTIRGGYFDGVWWAIVTASTVGYGDIAPSTFWGRAIAVLLMIAGIGLISTFSASITTYFVGQQEADNFREVHERLARMEKLLAELAENRSERAKAGTDTSLN